MMVSMLIIDASKEALQKVKDLHRVFHVYYLVLFQKNIKKEEI